MDIHKTLRQIANLQKLVHDTDIKVRQYLADRNRHPHPLHGELIERIRKYERQVSRCLRANRNAEVAMRMDNLMYSAMVHEQVWKRLFENASRAGMHESEAARVATVRQQAGSTHAAMSAAERRLIDKIYHISKKKWEQYGIEAAETREDLARRLLPEYQKMRREIPEGGKLGAVYDRHTHQVKLRVKKR